MAEAGKIKIGGLAEAQISSGGKSFRRPVKYDHIVITKTTRTQSDDLEIDHAMMAALLAHCGEDVVTVAPVLDEHGQPALYPHGQPRTERVVVRKLRRIPIALLSDDLEEVMPSTLAWYSGRTMLCRGDGEIATRYEIDGKRKIGRSMTCPCEKLEPNARGERECKPHAILRCMITVPGLAIAGACHVFRTTSYTSIREIRGSLEGIQHLIVGTVVGIPLWFVLKPVTMQVPEGGQRTIYAAHIELRAEDLQATQRQAIEAAKIRQDTRRAVHGDVALHMVGPAADEEDDEAQAETQEEFHPETGEIVDRGSMIDVPAADPELVDDRPPSASPPPTDERTPLQQQIGELLTKLAEGLIVLDPSLLETPFRQLRNRLWNEASEANCGHPVPWKTATADQLTRINDTLEDRLERVAIQIDGRGYKDADEAPP